MNGIHAALFHALNPRLKVGCRVRKETTWNEFFHDDSGNFGNLFRLRPNPANALRIKFFRVDIAFDQPSGIKQTDLSESMFPGERRIFFCNMIY